MKKKERKSLFETLLSSIENKPSNTVLKENEKPEQKPKPSEEEKKKDLEKQIKKYKVKGFKVTGVLSSILDRIDSEELPDKVYIERPTLKQVLESKEKEKKQLKKKKQKNLKKLGLIKKDELFKDVRAQERKLFTYLTKDSVLIEEYMIIPPFTKTQILYNKKEGIYIYNVVEPTLNEKEKEILDKLEELIIDSLEQTFFSFKTLKDAEKFVESRFDELIESQKWFFKSFKLIELSRLETKLKYYITRDLVYLGKIEPIMRDGYIEDISMDGIQVPVYVYHRKYGSMPTNIVFETLEEANSFVVRLAQKCRRHISLAEPRLDGQLPDGSRVQATYGKEITLRGPSFTIRKFKENPFTPAHLIFYNTFSPELMAYIWFVVEHQRTLMVAGGTASGKTTTLNAISLFMPSTSKIVSIEDTAEIRIPHQNWIQAVSRQGIKIGAQTYGEVSMEDLLKDALRQRPDYIIVGEIRGKEANVLFQAVATGHAGLGTMHADSVEAVVHRLLIRPIELPPSLLEHLDCILIQSRIKHGKSLIRRVLEVAEITTIDIETGYPKYDIVFEWNSKQDKIYNKTKSHLLYKKIARVYGYDEEEIDEELRKRAYFLQYLVKRRVFDYKEFHNWITKYYNDKEEILKRIRYYDRAEAKPTTPKD